MPPEAGRRRAFAAGPTGPSTGRGVGPPEPSPAFRVRPSAKFVALGDRLEKIKEKHEQVLIDSKEFLKQLLELARDLVEAEKQVDPVEEQDKAKTALTELFQQVKNSKTPVIVERIVADIDEIVRMVRFPGWQQTSTPRTGSAEGAAKDTAKVCPGVRSRNEICALLVGLSSRSIFFMREPDWAPRTLEENLVTHRACRQVVGFSVLRYFCISTLAVALIGGPASAADPLFKTADSVDMTPQQMKILDRINSSKGALKDTTKVVRLAQDPVTMAADSMLDVAIPAGPEIKFPVKIASLYNDKKSARIVGRRRSWI